MTELTKELRNEIDAYLEKRNEEIASTHMLKLHEGIIKHETEKLEANHKRAQIWTTILGVGFAGLLIAGISAIQSQAVDSATKEATEVAKDIALETASKAIKDIDDLQSKIEKADEYVNQSRNLSSQALVNLRTANDVESEVKIALEELFDLRKEVKSANDRLEDIFSKLSNDDKSVIAASISETIKLPKVQKDIASLAFPTGAVISSIRQCNELEPKNSWSNYDEAVGRTLIGAGEARPALPPSYKNYKMVKADGTVEFVPLKPYAGEPYDVEEVGGAERVRLGLREMPGHNHVMFSSANTNNDFPTNSGFVSRIGYTANNRGPDMHEASAIAFAYRIRGSGVPPDTGVTNTRGLSEPHNNMPPYIALYFCKKN